MTTVTLNNGTTVETGCYVDGHWGIYAIDHMMDQCAALVGFDDEMYPATENDDDYSDDENVTRFEVRHEMADELEQRLNGETPEGFIWHWSDGEFFLSPWCDAALTGDECDNDECACHVLLF